MFKSILASSALAVALVAGGASQVTVAQVDDEPVFEEVIVTAKKREQSIYEVPTAISAFSADRIEKQGIQNLVDIGKFVPNLNVTTFGAGHTSSANPFIRGIGLQDHLIFTDPGVSVYLDGVYLGRQIGQNWSLSNIERLEVLRGPQGTLYGRNSIGGAVNIITRKPGLEEGSRIALEAGSRGRVNADFFSDIALSDQLAVSLSGAFKRRDGIGEFLNVIDPEADVGELQDISARVAVLWEPSDDFSLLFTADGNDGRNGLNPYTTLIDELPNGAVFGAGFRNSDVAADPYNNNTGQVSQTGVTNQAYGLSVTADWAFNENLDGKVLVSERHSEYEAGLDDDSFVDDFLSFPEVGFADQTSVELQINGEFGALDFVSGIYFFEEDGQNYQDPTTFLTFPGTFTTGQDLESVAIYGNIGYAVSDQLRISGGVRFTQDEKDAMGDLNNSAFVGTGSRDWDEFSWDLAASYDISDSMTVYGSIANGYQSGQFPARPFCLFGDPNCLIASDTITAINYEAGIKGQPTDNLQMSIAVFFTDYSDLPYQVSTTAVGGFDTRNIIVDQQSTGVEWEGSVRLADGFFVHTSVGYIDVDVDDPQAVAPLTPELTASLSPEYTFPMAGGGALTFRADWSFRDEMFGEPSSDPGRLTMIDSRDLINADISYLSANEKWTVGLYGRNITDERYVNARLNTGDYILSILSNDASEYGIRFVNNF